MVPTSASRGTLGEMLLRKMEIVKYHNWTFELNKELTHEIYKKEKIGAPESCGCDDCLRYIKYRNDIFPKEIKLLFKKLGIIENKEAEIYYLDINRKKHEYGGWFHFIGKILNEPKIKNPKEFRSINFPVHKINNNIFIGFKQSNELCFNDFKDKQLVQLEFWTRIKVI